MRIQILLGVDNDIIEDNLQTSEENDELALNDNDETLSAKNDTDVLSDNSGTYSGLSAEIGSGRNIELQHDYYTYDTGNTISISVADSVIDGKGATIDMTGSNIRAFYVNASGVTIKNLTIINANYEGDGGAIYFSGSATSGTVEEQFTLVVQLLQVLCQIVILLITLLLNGAVQLGLVVQVL